MRGHVRDGEDDVRKRAVLFVGTVVRTAPERLACLQLRVAFDNLHAPALHQVGHNRRVEGLDRLRRRFFSLAPDLLHDRLGAP